jgi:hypothetical protein
MRIWFFILWTQRGGLPMSKFKPGQSGNPGGRPKGALNKVTLAAQALLDGEAEALTRKVVELAKAGNPMALRLCLERLLPPRKDRPINFTLPPLKEAKDIPSALGAILAAVAGGTSPRARAKASPPYWMLTGRDWISLILRPD